MCLNRGRITAATVVDHVEPHRDDPVRFWTGKVQSLCASCHSGPKASIEKRGMTRASGQTDGRQTPGIRCTDVRGRASDKVDGFERKKWRRKPGSAREPRGGVATR